MILMGDEVRRTQRGNNNAYCQDNEISWFDWDLCTRHTELLHFVQMVHKLGRVEACLCLLQVLRVRGGVDRLVAAVLVAVVVRGDRVGEPLFLANLLEQARRHAAAENIGQHLRGIEIARVIGADGQPIPGLHAIGNCAASAMGESYPGAGVTIGPALTFGYIAGRHAMQAPGAKA